MKKIITVLLTLCLITVVVPPVPESTDSEGYGISTCKYSYIRYTNL